MKLSTRSRYGTRMILEMARHYNKGPLQLGEIAKRQDISLKYLEQIIRPLKKAEYISSVRGPKGGHMLTRAPENITVGEVVAVHVIARPHANVDDVMPLGRGPGAKPKK